jgi:hypothetical protein
VAEILNLRLNDGDTDKLREMAGRLGIAAPSGGTQGQPSISRMLMMIASGELVVVRRKESR